MLQRIQWSIVDKPFLYTYPSNKTRKEILFPLLGTAVVVSDIQDKNNEMFLQYCLAFEVAAVVKVECASFDFFSDLVYIGC